MQTFKIKNLETKTRLTTWLKSNLHINYELIQKLIRKSNIKVNSKKTSKDYKLSNGDVITIYANINKQFLATRKVNPKLYSQLLEQIKNAIIFKDKNIIAINKPYGVATQGGSKIKISVDNILDDLKFESKIRPRLIHRLDKYTTGLLILARTKQIATLLADYFKNNRIEKKYLAVVIGKPQNKFGIVNSKIAKLGSEDLKEAITNYKVIASNTTAKISLIEFKPITGRTHQIRIHAAKNLQCPIVGDIKYGSNISIIPDLDKKMHLHSSEVKIKNIFDKNYSLKATLPTHIQLSIKKILAKLQN